MVVCDEVSPVIERGAVKLEQMLTTEYRIKETQKTIEDERSDLMKNEKVNAIDMYCTPEI